MSIPACAEGYDTPAQQRKDSTTFVVAKVSLFLNCSLPSPPAFWLLGAACNSSRFMFGGRAEDNGHLRVLFCGHATYRASGLRRNLKDLGLRPGHSFNFQVKAWIHHTQTRRNVNMKRGRNELVPDPARFWRAST